MRRIQGSLLPALAVLILIGCDSSAPSAPAPSRASLDIGAGGGVIASATGGGRYLLAGIYIPAVPLVINVFAQPRPTPPRCA